MSGTPGRPHARGWAVCAAALAVSSALLSGCRTVSHHATSAVSAQALAGLDWPARRAWLQDRARFSLQGKVAVTAGGDGFSGHLRWSQQDRLSTLNLEGPLGVGGLRVDSDGQRMDLARGSGQKLDGAAARAELEAHLGFEPPLMHLRYWIQGVPDPGLPAVETLDGAQRLAALAQDGWEIAYGAYQNQPGGLPQRLSLTRAGVRVRLVIDSWD